MTLRLVKTVGGENGSPGECDTCGSKHFHNAGVSWYCIVCRTYQPAKLGDQTLRDSLVRANQLLNEFNNAINDLERIVKKD